MEKWINEKLSDCLKFPVPDDLVQYIMDIENNYDLENYLKTLLNVENPHHRDFLTEILQRKKKVKASNKKKKSKQVVALNENASAASTSVEDKEGSKKKTKFINLYSQEGQNKEVILLKGRHHCDCQASKHTLINNCMKCGRIVCQQEGSGPCLFCGNLVCTIEEQQIINASTKKSTTLLNKLKDQKRPQGWEAALAHRNKLLEYDRTSERRTRVTDDDSDYFRSSVWLSKGEREKLEKYQQSLRDKKHASRLQQTFTLDFAGRQLVEEKSYDGEANEEAVREIMEAAQKMEISKKQFNENNDDYDGDLHPGYTGPAPQFDPSVESQLPAVVRADNRHYDHILRVQDAPLQEMTDRGSCLSMHQPWASLLVAGIKIHEGRNWYTSHRGRLWIASTVQQADTETVRSVENMYTILYPDETIKFPTFYPTACLLGCVNVENCLPQEEYRQKYPDGESESPFVLICTDPVELTLRFPVSGKHKIYTLNTTIHQAALKSMQKSAKIGAAA